MNNKKFLVITPTYNEIENIGEFIENINKMNLPALFIDDNSPDGTAKYIKNTNNFEKSIFLIERPKKLGLGSAYRCGFEWAIKNQYENIIEMDADFSHTVEDLENMTNSYGNYKALIGSRYVQGGKTIGWEPKRLLLSTVANKFAKFMIGSPVTDMTSGFRILNSNTLDEIEYQNSKSNGYAFQIEILARIINKNIDVKEVPITFLERRKGQSKLERKIIYEALYLVIKLGVKNFISKFK